MDRIEISSILGQKVVTKEITAFQIDIDVSSFSKGLYILKVNSQGQEKIVKIIKD